MMNMETYRTQRERLQCKALEANRGRLAALARGDFTAARAFRLEIRQINRRIIELGTAELPLPGHE
jgi:hypothetical protein